LLQQQWLLVGEQVLVLLLLMPRLSLLLRGHRQSRAMCCANTVSAG
jgi:hypothetical protein